MNSTLDRPSVLAAMSGVGVAAIIVFAVMPVLVGAMAERYQLGDLESGLIATAYFSTYAVVALLSPLWVRRWSWRLVSTLGYALLCSSLLVTYIADSFAVAQLAIASAGVGAGLLYPISLTLASDMEQAERAFAIKLAMEQLVPALLLVLLSIGVLMAGLDALLLAMIGVIGVCILSSRALPARGKSEEEVFSEGGSLFLSLLALVSLSIVFAGFAGIWVFLERIGADADFDPAFTNLWLAVGLISSGVGPALAAVYAERSGVIKPIAVGMALAVLTIALMAVGTGKLVYAFVLTVLPLVYYFSLSYVMGLVAEADVNGKMAGLMSFSLAVGAALGPAFFGAIRELDGPVLAVMCLLIATGTGLILLVAQRVVPQRAALME